MKLRHAFLFLSIAGVILPYWYFVPWFLDNGLNVRLFFEEIFSTRIGGSFGMDVIVSTVVLLLFAVTETFRLKMRRAGLIIAAVFLGTFVAGVSCGFPLFLYLRQKHLDARQ
jgi:hypothetical protein